MTEIPEHLLQRSRERRKALGLPVPGEEGGEAAPAEAQDKVHTWPHLLVVEFAALLIVTAGLTIFSAAVRAPLLQLADFNKTPNPSKAPWYFLGLQELLTMFHPMVAGVTIPGMG